MLMVVVVDLYIFAKDAVIPDLHAFHACDGTTMIEKTIFSDLYPSVSIYDHSGARAKNATDRSFYARTI